MIEYIGAELGPPASAVARIEGDPDDRIVAGIGVGTFTDPVWDPVRDPDPNDTLLNVHGNGALLIGTVEQVRGYLTGLIEYIDALGCEYA